MREGQRTFIAFRATCTHCECNMPRTRCVACATQKPVADTPRRPLGRCRRRTPGAVTEGCDAHPARVRHASLPTRAGHQAESRTDSRNTKTKDHLGPARRGTMRRRTAAHQPQGRNPSWGLHVQRLVVEQCPGDWQGRQLAPCGSPCREREGQRWCCRAKTGSPQ